MQENRLRLLESKVQIPDVQKEFQVREELLEELERSKSRLFVLHAAIGYGKTVLLAQYARRQGHICAWYCLDALDNELATFIQYLSLAVRRALGDDAFEAGLCVSEGELPPGQMIRELVTNLTEYLHTADKKMVLVLDDFQALENPQIFMLLDELLEHTTGRLTLMVATKSMVPELFSRYFMQNQGSVFGFEELSFKKEEVWAVVRRMLSEEDAKLYSELIWNNMEGWPAGIMCAVLYLRQLGGDARKVEWNQINLESLIRNYVTHELFKRLPYELQQFLLCTSFAEELQPELCNEICGIHNAGGILKYLLQENMFIMHMGGKAGSYRYHSMFRQFLQDRAGEELQRKFCGKIARYYLRRREEDVALSYVLKAGDMELLTVILEKRGFAMLKEGKRRQAEECLKRLTDERAAFTPKIKLLVAVCAFLRKERTEGRWALLEACRQIPEYAAYQRLYEGLLSEEEEERRKLVAQGCRMLLERKWELPPLDGADKDFVERIWSSENKDRAALSVRCFGGFEVKVQPEGRELSWRTRKAMELFAYLVDLEGRPVERKDLIRNLWPDNEPNNAVAMLHNMIYSIRRELSPWPELKGALCYKGRQYYLDMSLLTTDLAVFQEICELAEQGKVESLYRYREQILYDYGSYLEDVDGEWCGSRRTYFERAYEKACRLLARYCRERKDLETEALFWNAYWETDRYSEEALAGLLRCYGEMGERGLVKKVYESAKKLFLDELGLEPGEEVRRVYEQGIGKKGV